jgi:hypothetical protein
MKLLDFILANPDVALAAVTTIGGWLGLNRWRKKSAKAAEIVDRCAAAAVVALERVIASGKVPKTADHAAKIMKLFREFLAAYDVHLTPELELRAKSRMADALNHAAKYRADLVPAAIDMSSALLGETANDLLHDIRARDAAAKRKPPAPR